MTNGITSIEINQETKDKKDVIHFLKAYNQ